MSIKIKAALIQLLVSANKTENYANIAKLIKTAKKTGAELVVLPECWNSWYDMTKFFHNSERIPDGPSSRLMSDIAKEQSIYLVGGTIPERTSSNFYNTCTVWNPKGDLIAKFRKLHLFDVDIPQGITFKESEVVSPGDRLVIFSIKDVRAGLGICYDLRFEEMARLYQMAGCKLLIYPAAFSIPSGKLHWELMLRGRANDTQAYVIGASQATSKEGFIAYGYSMVVDPLAQIIVTAGQKPTILYAEMDMANVDSVRAEIPTVTQRRYDLYETISKSEKSILK